MKNLKKISKSVALEKDRVMRKRLSGENEGISRISKRGNRHLRRVIFLMTLCAVRSQNIFREYFLKRKEEGLPPKKAILATAHKLLRVLFAMLTRKSYFRREVVEV